MQLALRAEGVDHAVGDDRHRARPFVESEVVAIGRGVGVAPHRVAGRRVERFEDFFVADAVKEDDAVADDGGTGEALSDLLAPDDLRAVRSPGVGKAGPA